MDFVPVSYSARRDLQGMTISFLWVSSHYYTGGPADNLTALS